MTDEHRKVLSDLLICCRAWEPQACVLGNVRAGDAADAISAVLAAAHPEPVAPCKDCPGRQSLMCCKQPREPAAPTLTEEDRRDLRVAAIVFMSGSYAENPQAQRVAATLKRLGGVAPAAPTLCPIPYCHRSVQERDKNGCKHCRPSGATPPTPTDGVEGSKL